MSREARGMFAGATLVVAALAGGLVGGWHAVVVVLTFVCAAAWGREFLRG